jgi:hypothetical protein
MKNGFGVALALALLGAPTAAHAWWTAPGHIELRVEPQLGLTGFANVNGLAISVPDHGSTVAIFGFGAALGVLVTPMIEPGFSLNFQTTQANTSSTSFGGTPFLKFNFWSTRHVNPFLEPFAGFVLANAGGDTETFFDGGLFTGVDLLVTTWGIRLWTGFEAIAGDNSHSINIPARWALVAYF